MAETPVTLERSPGNQQNFVDAKKSRKQPESNLAYFRQMTMPMHLGLITTGSASPGMGRPQREIPTQMRCYHQTIGKGEF